MLGCLRRAFDLLEDHKGVAVDMATVPPGDSATYAMTRRADTLGTLQIASRAADGHAAVPEALGLALLRGPAGVAPRGG